MEHKISSSNVFEWITFWQRLWLPGRRPGCPSWSSPVSLRHASLDDACPKSATADWETRSSCVVCPLTASLYRLLSTVSTELNVYSVFNFWCIKQINFKTFANKKFLLQLWNEWPRRRWVPLLWHCSVWDWLDVSWKPPRIAQVCFWKSATNIYTIHNNKKKHINQLRSKWVVVNIYLNTRW